MIDLKHNKNGFSLSLNKYKLINHTHETPCLELGKSIGNFKDEKGVFKISESVDETYALSDFEIVSDSSDRIEIRLFKENISINLILEDKDNQLEITPTKSSGDFNRFKINFVAEKAEGIFGCGEQFSEFNLRGKKVPLWAEEQGICRGDPKIITWLLNVTKGVGGSWYTTYHPQPTFISSNKYFCHVETSAYAIFDFSNEYYHSLYFWETPEKLIVGKFESITETVSKLSLVLGRQPKLPDWIYDGMILAIQGAGGLDRVRDRLKYALDSGVQVNGIWSQDWQGIKVTSFGTQLFWDWKWDGNGREIRFPSFPDFVKEMNDKGIKYLGYINSFLNIDGDLYKEASEKGYVVKKPDGSDYYIYVTTFPAALVDLTNPDARTWIKEIMKNNMIKEAGLSGWMSDFGEYLPTDAVLHSGISGEKYHNLYPVEWQKVNYEALEEAGKLGEIVYFTRSGYSHTSKYSTLIWAGDQLVNWSMDDGLASVIPAALSLGICGVGYHHSDVGGYTTFKPVFTRSKEVFMRWAEQAAFTMVMRSHESNQPEANWQFDTDEEIITHLAAMTKIHVKLKPYLMKLSDEYQKTGIPPIRPIFMHYEDDIKTYGLKYEYLLGRDLLIAPVIKKKKKKWKVYLPDDEWVHLWTGREFKQGNHVISAEIGFPPVFYKKGSEYTTNFEDIKKIY